MQISQQGSCNKRPKRSWRIRWTRRFNSPDLR